MLTAFGGALAYIRVMLLPKFRNLSIGAKLLITLIIPMTWLLALTGKRVSDNLARHDVYAYIRDQSLVTEVLSNVIHELQKEKALVVGFLAGKTNNTMRLGLQFEQSDLATEKLLEMVSEDPDRQLLAHLFDEQEAIRSEVLARKMDSRKATRYYSNVNRICLDEVSQVSKLSLSPGTKDLIYAHLSLLYAKESLGVVRAQLNQALYSGEFTKKDYTEFAEEIGRYRNFMFQFQRDAHVELSTYFDEVFRGSEVIYFETITGTITEEQVLDQYSIDPEKWWTISTEVMDRLKLVEDASLEKILVSTESNLAFAQGRLWTVVGILLFVLLIVTLLSTLIWREIRRSIKDVQAAAHALSLGNFNVKVIPRSNDEFGDLARAINTMIGNIENAAASANMIGEGDLDTRVEIRSEGDVLGKALVKMKEDLREAREKDEALSRLLQKDKEKLEEANDQIKMLIKEIHHRVKNNLQVVASLLRLQASGIDDPKLTKLFDQSQDRVRSMALIHEKLYRGAELNELSVSTYLEELIAELIRVNDVRDSIKFNIEIPDVDLGLDTLVPLGLVMNELVTNSFKHAFVNKEEGLIKVSIEQMDEKNFIIHFADDGIGIPQEKLDGDRDSLGMDLIDSLVDQMNGEFKVQSGAEGTQYTITFKSR